jgi:hypothetical protein
MNEQTPPAWGEDPLSRFFAEAEFNTRAAALNFPPIYELLREVDGIFRRIEEATGHGSDSNLLVSQFLLIRAHSSVLGSIRLSMSGQTTESTAVLRSALEAAWYALHIAKDPNPVDRIRLWFNRNDCDADKARCKSEFTIANVRKTLEGLDSVTALSMQQVYELLIDFGAHPNQLGVMTALSIPGDENNREYRVGILHPEPADIAFALKLAVDVSVSVFKVYGFISPERLQLMGIDQDIKNLIPKSNQMFRSYSNRFGRA